MQTLPRQTRGSMLPIAAPCVIIIPHAYDTCGRPGTSPHPDIITHLATGALRSDNIHDDIPEGLKWKDQGSDVVESEVKGAGMRKRVQTIDTGGNLQKGASLAFSDFREIRY